MKVTRQFARRFRLLELLRTLLGLAGALFVVAAVLALAAPGVLEDDLGFRFPPEPLLSRLFAVLLVPLAGCCFLAARDPRRYSGLIILAIGTPVLAALALAITALRTGTGDLWVPAAAAVAFALATAAAWLPLRV